MVEGGERDYAAAARLPMRGDGGLDEEEALG
jgi:hypothetical protein